MLIIIYFSALSFLMKGFLSEHDKHYIFIDILNLTLILFLFFEVVKMRNSLKNNFLLFGLSIFILYILALVSTTNFKICFICFYIFMFYMFYMIKG